MVMTASVTHVQRGNLLVHDLNTNQEVLVHFRDSDRFLAGDTVKITFDGKMTRSIPPQITADSIQLFYPQPSAPARIRATVIEKGRQHLIVRDPQNNRQLRVNFSSARHFCVGQRITITYDTIVMSNPPTINAIDIVPIC